MIKKPKKTYQFGIAAERLVIWFLRLKGYSILSWRYKTYFGEIDLIAKKGKTIIFIEVKARKSSELIEIVLRPKQVERIKKAAEFFIAKNPKFHNYDCRFDFVQVDKFFIPKHHKNFW